MYTRPRKTKTDNQNRSHSLGLVPFIYKHSLVKQILILNLDKLRVLVLTESGSLIIIILNIFQCFGVRTVRFYCVIIPMPKVVTVYRLELS